jgi:hypothetical protein
MAVSLKKKKSGWSGTSTVSVEDRKGGRGEDANERGLYVCGTESSEHCVCAHKLNH